MTLIAGSPARLDWSGRRAETWSWLPSDEIESETLQQVRDIGSLDVAVRVAVMPDAHKGYGMPIGCMLATNGAVVPYAVGVDIGCGMLAAKRLINRVSVEASFFKKLSAMENLVYAGRLYGVSPEESGRRSCRSSAGSASRTLG